MDNQVITIVTLTMIMDNQVSTIFMRTNQRDAPVLISSEMQILANRPNYWPTWTIVERLIKGSSPLAPLLQ